MIIIIINHYRASSIYVFKLYRAPYCCNDGFWIISSYRKRRLQVFTLIHIKVKRCKFCKLQLSLSFFFLKRVYYFWPIYIKSYYSGLKNISKWVITLNTSVCRWSCQKNLKCKLNHNLAQDSFIRIKSPTADFSFLKVKLLLLNFQSYSFLLAKF